VQKHNAGAPQSGASADFFSMTAAAMAFQGIAAALFQQGILRFEGRYWIVGTLFA
jgi:hypothetical protein